MGFLFVCGEFKNFPLFLGKFEISGFWVLQKGSIYWDFS
jgi:hypothetical protein